MNSVEITIASIVTLFIASGCNSLSPGPMSILAERPDYNDRIQQSSKAQVFENIVRVYEADIPQFLDVTQITAQMAVSGTLTGSAMLPQMVAGGGTVAVTQGGTSSGQVVNTKTLTFNPGHDFSAGGTLVLSETPTITYQPLQGQALVQQIVTPMTVDNIVSLNDSNWAPGTVLTFAAARLAPNEAFHYVALNAIIDLNNYGAITLGGEVLGNSASTSSSGGSGGNASTPKSNALVIYRNPADDTSAPQEREYIQRLWECLQWIYGQYVTRISLERKQAGASLQIRIKGTATPVATIKDGDQLDHVRTELGQLLPGIKAGTITVTGSDNMWDVKWSPGTFQKLEAFNFQNCKALPTKIVMDSSNKIELPMLIDGSGAKTDAAQSSATSMSQQAAAGSTLINSLIVGFGFQQKQAIPASGNPPQNSLAIPSFRTRSALGILKSFHEASERPAIVLSAEEYKKFVVPQMEEFKEKFKLVDRLPDYYFFDKESRRTDAVDFIGKQTMIGIKIMVENMRTASPGLLPPGTTPASIFPKEPLDVAACQISEFFPMDARGTCDGDSLLENFRLAQYQAALLRHYIVIVKTTVPPSAPSLPFTHKDPEGNEPYVYYDYEGVEYQIAKNDLISRRNFNLISQFLTMQAVAPTQNPGPTQTIGSGGGAR